MFNDLVLPFICLQWINSPNNELNTRMDNYLSSIVYCKPHEKLAIITC